MHKLNVIYAITHHGLYNRTRRDGLWHMSVAFCCSVGRSVGQSMHMDGDATTSPLSHFLRAVGYHSLPARRCARLIFTRSVSNYAQSRKKVPFWGLRDGRKHLGGQIPPKPSKFGVNMLCRASQLRVNQNWRHSIMTSLARCSVSVVN